MLTSGEIRVHRLIVLVSALLLGVFILLLLDGCSIFKSPTGIGRDIAKLPENFTGAQGAVAAVYKTNWALSIAVIGVTASVFAICMGLRQIGAAGLAASFTMAAMSIAMIRFAWIFGIGGLLIGIGTGLAALMKNRQTIFGFIDGFQAVKDEFKIGFQSDIPATPGQARGAANAAMGSHFTDLGEQMVKTRKTAIEQLT